MRTTRSTSPFIVMSLLVLTIAFTIFVASNLEQGQERDDVSSNWLVPSLDTQLARLKPTVSHAAVPQLAFEPTLVPPPLTQTEPQNLPILIYHTTPPDFSDQLQTLVDRGYTTVSLEEVESSWHDGPALPSKPVVLTFDDGLADQMNAFTILKQFQMKATFYIINGGAASRWCIGASRRYNDPLQPPGGCGDAYLNWDQIRMLDRSGLITIGGHTLDHPELPKLDETSERTEISASKAGIEKEIGHSIYDFAYPYGEYDDTTIRLVKEAGYATAVTTVAGTEQDPTSPYTLSRIRTTYDLP